MIELIETELSELMQKAEDGTVAYVSVEKSNHHKTVQDLEVQIYPPEPPEDSTFTEHMRYRLKTKQGLEAVKG